jgi:hypothetical protein
VKALNHRSLAPYRSPPVEIAPDVEWLDRVTGRAAVDPSFRELLLSRPGAALGDEPLPAALFSALSSIRARDLSEYARLAIETEAAFWLLIRAARLEELGDVRGRAGAEPVGAAA